MGEGGGRKLDNGDGRLCYEKKLTASGSHFRPNDLARMTSPASAGGPTPLEERAACCAGTWRPRLRHWRPYAWAPSPRPWASSPPSGHHRLRHSFELMTPPGEEGRLPPSWICFLPQNCATRRTTHGEKYEVGRGWLFGFLQMQRCLILPHRHRMNIH